MAKTRERTIGIITIIGIAITIIGCSGGGGTGGDGGPSNPSNPGTPTLQVLPATFNFGTVTTGNSPAPLEVKINNTGSAALNVSNIVLSDATNFSLNMNAGSSPCGGPSAVIAAGGTCTFEVGFIPTSNAQFTSSVTISSNDPNNPSVQMQLSGISELVSSLIVRINQAKLACPGEHTAYVSVTDQAGYPLVGLTPSNFLVSLDGTALVPTSVEFVSKFYATISIAAAMDYSSSITDTPDATIDMENGLVDFVSNMKPGDQAEIIKFDSEVEVVQPFISDTIALTNAILSPFDLGDYTKLYDAVYKAVDNTGATTTDRKAVIVLTDGKDEWCGGCGPFSLKTLSDVIQIATEKNVPIFPIGIGTNIDSVVLESMAENTGGQFFDSLSSDNLRTIYQQLSSILFENQYIVKFNATLNSGDPASELKIVVQAGSTGEDIKKIYCP